MTSLADIAAFWGKARPRDDAVTPVHPVVHHLLDVAAAADAILAARPLTLARGAALLGVTPDDARRLLVALVALHDLGKFAPAFQAQVPEAWPTRLGRLDPSALTPSRHTEDGYALWFHDLAPVVSDRLWREGRPTLDALAPGIFGHHGRPVSPASLRARPARWTMGAVGVDAAVACADLVLRLLMPAPIAAPRPSSRQARIASWWVAGLVTVADWVGSRQEWFPYRAADPGDAELRGYWDRARALARDAIRAAGLEASPPSPAMEFAELTGIDDEPSPLQRWASSTELPAGPSLIVLEDVTGSGKTEAAQMLVHRLMAEGRAAGAYWAMPTQATANAMYERQREAIQALYALRGDRRPSIVLAHGQSRLHDRFRATVLGNAERDPEATATGGPSDELTSGAACAAFLADDRRAALLADVGAGTVDQALLGILPSRFNAVRLFGLSDKVLIVDEAHAYDAYVDVELQELLRFHAALGGSAVVLSATLSLEQRESLVQAWGEGVDGGRRSQSVVFAAGAPSSLVHERAYPLATVAAPGEPPVREVPIDPAPRSSRSVKVRLVDRVDDALQHTLAAVQRGSAAAWIRNAIDDCLEAAAALREAGVAPIVFHARFAQCDRQAREREVLELFGPKADPSARRGRVVVATQVIEQSLDLDFDAMASDLAPVDLLVQRAGRLHRHPHRDGSRPVERELVVVSPPAVPDPGREWLQSLLPRTGRVYENVGILWRTARVLAKTGEIRTPEGLRDLIEAVYGDGEDVPAALVDASQRAEGRAHGDAATANFAALKVGDGYHGDAHGWVDDLRAPTRLGDAQTTLRLARVAADGALLPWCEMDGPAWKQWSLSEVRVRATRVPPNAMADPDFLGHVDAIRAEWGRFERDIPLLPLQEDGGVWRGTLHDPARDRRIAIRYTREEGLSFERDAGA